MWLQIDSIKEECIYETLDLHSYKVSPKRKMIIKITGVKDVVEVASKYEEPVGIVVIDQTKFYQAADYTRKWQDTFDEGRKRGKEEAKNDRWIPVSERLPEEDGEDYLVTLNNGEVEKTYFYERLKGFKGKNIWGCELFDDVQVVAWQPYPEPYKEDEK